MSNGWISGFMRLKLQTAGFCAPDLGHTHTHTLAGFLEPTDGADSVFFSLLLPFLPLPLTLWPSSWRHS